MPIEVKLGPLLYEGKAKRMWETADPNLMVMEFKDSLTAFDAAKTGSFTGKGTINNLISAHFFTLLKGIPTHFVQMLDETRSLVRRVEIVLLEVIFRFKADGSICKRYGMERGHTFDPPLLEFGLKNDALHDPFFADPRTPVEMGLCSYGELEHIRYLAPLIAHQLRIIYDRAGIDLWDGKLEFGRWHDKDSGSSRIILADEVTPDTCRLTDKKTGRKLDKDLFRFDLGDIDAGYRDLFVMLGINTGELLPASCVTFPAISDEGGEQWMAPGPGPQL